MTDVALKEYFEKRLEEMDRRYTDRFLASEVSVSKAERTINERLNSMNEFRDALKDQSSRMATRSEVDKIDHVVRDLQNAKANLDGRLMMLAGSVSIAVSVVLWVILRGIH